MGNIDKTVIDEYSSESSGIYDAAINKNFLYGKITTDFLESIELKNTDKTVLDIGCGTGLCFELLKDKFIQLDINGIGIDPAEGMLLYAIKKFQTSDRFTFKIGTFEDIPLEDNSVDKIISTLALHWATSIEKAVQNMVRVLKPGGSIDILMIEKNDGAQFKRFVIEAMKKHLTFKQIMKAAALAQRVTAAQLHKVVNKYFDRSYEINVKNIEQLIYGTFEEHIKWWSARSSATIVEVKDSDAFFRDLQEEMRKSETDNGIPFDLSCLILSVKKKNAIAREDVIKQLKEYIQNETKTIIKSSDEELDIDSLTMMLIITYAHEIGAKLNMDTLDFDAFKSLNTLADMIINLL